MSARALLERVFRQALEECAPERVVYDRLEPRDGDRGFAMPAARFDVKLAAPGKLWLFGAGKASLRMAEGVLAKLGQQIRGGTLIIPEKQPAPERLGPVRILRGSHPDPTALSVASTTELLKEAALCAPDEHVLFVLSGGASALLEAPNEGITIEEESELARKLMSAGAAIYELNVVRKHLSRVKGGRLAGHFACGVSVLVFSDVAGNDFATIGSGPFVRDPSTLADAEAILKARGVEACASLRETPKQLSSEVRHVLLASGQSMAEAAFVAAAREGLPAAHVNNVPVTDEVMVLARKYAVTVRERLGQGASETLIRFGEPVVHVTSSAPGDGGRSQQLALLVARELQGVAGWAFLAAGTDGADGSSNATGAVVDGETWDQACRLGLDPGGALFEKFDSGRVFAAMSQSLVTGLTGNNLQDLHILTLSPPK